eukprot:gene8429-11403_t
MESYVLKTLKRLRKEAPRRFKDLRIICDELIVALSEKEKANGAENQDSDADKYFEPLEAACETKQARLMDIALDALHFLIEHGYLRGKRKLQSTMASNSEEGDNEGKEEYSKTLMDSVVETVSKCSDEYDEVVQLQVIKVLLTAITSLHCEVHEASLLMAVRACFHIHLITKNPINKTTAKAALTQMLSVVNQRMELCDATIKAETDSHSIKPAMVESDTLDEEFRLSVEEDSQKQLSSESNNGEEPLSALQARLQNSRSGVREAAITTASFPSIYHKDSYLLFRALCKLSMKGLNEETSSSNDQIALQNKILSLELILTILNNSSVAFRTGEKFIYAIRNYLCVSLLSNCTSHVAQVTGLALQIFVVLMHNFKEHLKSEMEIFISTIFLRILESENSTYDHKFRVLEVFQAICKDPSAQIELFINYDCDLGAINLFSRVVDAFAKIAKNPMVSTASRGVVAVDFISSVGKKMQLEEQNIRTMGLEGLIIIIRSLEYSAGMGINSVVPVKTNKLTSNGSGNLPVIAEEDYSNSVSITPNFKGINTATSASVDDTANMDDEIRDAAASAVDNSANVMEVFDKKQKIQEEIETGILKFNLSSKKGLAYLSALGHIELTPKGVVEFFRTYQDKLDKTVIGDFLGREREYDNGFCLKVLHEYVQSMDFSGMAFDLAIRHFLGGFRLPGEAQKIDRIMEKFAERYYIQNSETFASADMAFILAFSTIMLQTNLHNPAIRDDKRMTKEQFIKQNKGISSDGELPDDMLSEIYDRIAAEPISITQDDKANRRNKKEEQNSFVVFQASNDKRKKDAFNNERKEMVRAGEAMIRQFSKRNSNVVFRNSSQADEAYVKPMFEVVWPPIMGVLSQILETHDDAVMIQLCLSGFQHCIRLACRMDIPLARNTFINALVKFTTLDSVREMRQKNVLCIKLLMSVALAEGDHLEESWGQILQNISQLSRLQLFANGSHFDDLFFSDTASVVSSSDNSRTSGRTKSSLQSLSKSHLNDKSPSDPFTKLFLGPSKAETTRLVEEANAELVTRDIDPVQIDRIYQNSVNLTGESVRYFVKSLCRVSLLEISTSSTMNSFRGNASVDSSTPRIFSLQKLVEVADFNMYSRSRMDWTNIWTLLASHFSLVGLHENQQIAMYSIDSLKQLSIKFLQKEELSNFNFQRVFLKPFETIISKSKSYEIKDLILRCIEIMIKACAKNIHSGWRSIFAIFEVAANQDYVEIATISFEITEQLMSNQFDLLIVDFVGIMNCLVAFAACAHTALSIKALNYLSRCADHLANGTINPVADQSPIDTNNNNENNGNATIISNENSNQINEDASVFRLWWPLLLGLATRVSDLRLQVRVKALNTLHVVLSNYGYLFSPQTWSVIFKGVLFPIIDSAKTDSTPQPISICPTENPPPSSNPNSWIGTMGLNVLTVCLELYQTFRDKDRFVPLLPDLISMLEGCICQDTESLAKMGLRVLHDLVISLAFINPRDNQLRIENQHAELICNRLINCLNNNLCLNFGSNGNIRMEGKNIPSFVSSFFNECPILRRRRRKDGVSRTLSNSIAVGNVIQTPYGMGTVAAIIPPENQHGVQLRNQITLSWGATLYSSEGFEITEKIEYDDNVTQAKSLYPSWIQHSASIMTSMVVSLEIVRIMGEIVNTYSLSWQLKHYSSFLFALEVSHWHAVSFNSSIELRLRLAEAGFMRIRSMSTIYPHLLDQEIISIEHILKIIFRLYNYNGFDERLVVDDDNDDKDRFSHIDFNKQKAMQFAYPWVERMSCMVFHRYLELEETSTDEDDEEDDDSVNHSSAVLKGHNGIELNYEAFCSNRHDRYQKSVIIILEAIIAFEETQFNDNMTWLVPVLSRLILCHNKDVRIRVIEIYRRFVNPRLLK